MFIVLRVWWDVREVGGYLDWPIITEHCTSPPRNLVWTFSTEPKSLSEDLQVLRNDPNHLLCEWSQVRFTLEATLVLRTRYVLMRECAPMPIITSQPCTYYHILLIAYYWSRRSLYLPPNSLTRQPHLNPNTIPRKKNPTKMRTSLAQSNSHHTQLLHYCHDLQDILDGVVRN